MKRWHYWLLWGLFLALCAILLGVAVYRQLYPSHIVVDGPVVPLR